MHARLSPKKMRPCGSRQYRRVAMLLERMATRNGPRPVAGSAAVRLSPDYKGQIQTQVKRSS